ncbi:PREDICTED: uncharacterized protein LOC109590784 [Amphimedon queenslandica]|uniref:Uncharacterized protein n=2 Tax=Amphimedon queenslandica TaxID=400682 RepID=A0AAN0JZ68_AMPQE|nr:PREDICTED: uncharacterized protein LOC109590784 [Amphimedon queenslandica]|eukprot:XP_019862218.1 PREDICTED: uncharacterized protein LOC109590784 [Amphimedon queenslandica]
MGTVAVGGVSVAAGLAAAGAAPLTAVAVGFVGVATIGSLALSAAFKKVPSFHCRGLFYKNCLPEKVVMSLAVLQDLPSSKKLFQGDSAIQSLLGKLQTTFRFTFSKNKDHHLKVTNFPSKNIKGWKFTQCNPPVISESHVAEYSASKGSEPPYIQVSVEPDETDATNKISHALSIDGIQTLSDASTVQWSIEVSKNDLLSTTPFSVVPSFVAATSMENVQPEDQQIQQLSLDPQLAVKAFRKQFGTLSKLLSVSSNRLAVAPELFSGGLITFNCYKNATEGSSKTEEEKSTGLMISLMSTISTQPELLTELINVLNRTEPFKLIATKLVEASYR